VKILPRFNVNISGARATADQQNLPKKPDRITRGPAITAMNALPARIGELNLLGIESATRQVGGQLRQLDFDVIVISEKLIRQDLVGYPFILIHIDQIVGRQDIQIFDESRFVDDEFNSVFSDLDDVAGRQFSNFGDFLTVQTRAIATAKVANVKVPGNPFDHGMGPAGAIVGKHDIIARPSAQSELIPCKGNALARIAIRTILDLEKCSTHVPMDFSVPFCGVRFETIVARLPAKLLRFPELT